MWIFDNLKQHIGYPYMLFLLVNIISMDLWNYFLWHNIRVYKEGSPS